MNKIFLHYISNDIIMNKNIWLLVGSEIFGFTADSITVFLSGIIGSQISLIKSISTLPILLSIVGTAIFTLIYSKKLP